MQNNHFKKCKVVMIPTKDKTNLWLDNIINKLYSFACNSGKKNHYHHLYIISDEKIHEYDYYINMSDMSIKQANYNDTNEFSLLAYSWACKKIIGSTNILLIRDSGHDISKDDFVPKISNNFINDYIKNYNKDNIINDILVEYEVSNNIEILKINKDSTIIIKKIKDKWNREEVIELIKDAMITGVNIRDKNLIFNDIRDKWIEENL